MKLRHREPTLSRLPRVARVGVGYDPRLPSEEERADADAIAERSRPASLR